MGALDNAKWEKFIQEYSRNGGNGRSAYKAAYPNANDHTAETAAGRLLKKVEVRARYDELMREAAQRVVQDVADQTISDMQEAEHASVLLAEAIETIRKIHTGEICDEVQELDDNGEWKVTKRTSRAADRQRAAEKIIEMYGDKNDEAIRIELVGGAEGLAD